MGVENLDLSALTWTLPARGEPLRLVVLGDSTAFTDDRGPQLPTEPGLYPNVLARHIEESVGRPVHTTVVARAGVTVRDVLRTVTKDRHVMFDVLAGADIAVIAIGGFDHAPAGVPAAVDAVVPFLRPDRVRRRVRRSLTAAYPWIVRATGGRRHRTPPAEFERLFDRVLVQVRGLTRGAPGVVLGPTSQQADYYARRAPRFREAEARQFVIAARHGYPTCSVWDHVEPFLDQLNVDGIHWPAAAHARVGAAAADAVVPQLTGTATIPGIPGSQVAP